MSGHTMRGCFLLLLILSLTGCIRRHTLEWPGAIATASTALGADARYSRIGWHGHPGEICTEIVCHAGPAFSVRLPDGQIVKPADFTLASLEARGAKERHPAEGTRPPAQRTVRLWKLQTTAGTLTATFDQHRRLVSIRVNTTKGVGYIALGDRSGRRLVRLPASRDELVELIGEPKREYERSPNWPQMGQAEYAPRSPEVWS